MKSNLFSLICILSLSILFSPVAVAQTKTLTMEDVVLSERHGLIPSKLDQLQWIPGTSDVSYIKKEKPSEILVSESVNGKEVKQLVSSAQLNNALKQLRKDTLTVFPKISWTSADKFIFAFGEETFSYTISSGVASMVFDKPAPDAANKEINPVNTAMAYTIDNNLWIITADRKIEVTSDKDPNIVNGQIVHREEFGITKGTFWSASGNSLAFYRMDQTMVTDYPILDLDAQPAGVKMVKYPMAGGKSHEVTIGIYDMRNGKTVFLQTGLPAEQYLTNISWTPDDKKILVAVLNREQNHLKLNRYDVATGQFEATLFEEKDSSYIQPLHAAIFNKKGTAFIWQSRRDGYNHLYYYESSGKLIRQLTKGNWEVTDCKGFNIKEDKVCFTGTVSSPINRDSYTVSVSNGSLKKLSSKPGINSIKMNSTGDYFIDELSAPGIPRLITIVNSDGKILKQLLNAENPLNKFAPVIRETFTIKSESGDDLYCRMLKPGNFDSTKTYPVIVYVYGGPGINLISNNWLSGADLWQHFMAQRGFIIFSLENRGTPNRGEAFEQSTFRNLGDVELQDQISGAKYLMSKRYIDRNRMGVYGWSFGGFMSVSLMTRAPGTFRIGVAGGPVIDWSYYEVMYTERYMDTPKENPDGYKRSNLLNYVDKLSGKLLLIHGTSDDVVVWQNSLLYLKAAVEKNKQVDYFVYPGHEHNITGRDRIHLLTKVADYFFRELQ